MSDRHDTEAKRRRNMRRTLHIGSSSERDTAVRDWADELSVVLPPKCARCLDRCSSDLLLLDSHNLRKLEHVEIFNSGGRSGSMRRLAGRGRPSRRFGMRISVDLNSNRLYVFHDEHCNLDRTRFFAAGFTTGRWNERRMDDVHRKSRQTTEIETRVEVVAAGVEIRRQRDSCK